MADEKDIKTMLKSIDMGVFLMHDILEKLLVALIKKKIIEMPTEQEMDDYHKKYDKCRSFKN